MTTQNENYKISEKQVCELRGQLLDWYDAHRRSLPWRLEKSKIEEGLLPDPYHVWLSEIMLQQTTVGAVKPYFEKFLTLWPRIQDLAAASQDDVMAQWAGLGYYARARNLHKCAKVVSDELDGVFPETIAELKALPGIGEYTSAAIRAIAFNKPATVVDGNIERVMARYFAIEAPMPKSKAQLKKQAALFFERYQARPGDLAQCLMDIGATICISKTPRCSLCPVSEKCQGRIMGIAASLPRKEKKKPRPQKFGHVYWIENVQGQILVHKRPESGLLGGMNALPTSQWVERSLIKDLAIPSFIKQAEDLSEKPLSIHHVFTHFELELVLKRVSSEHLNSANLNDEYSWIDPPNPKNSGFPSLFQKALKVFTV